MISNSSGTAGCDQILKQMMYGRKKVRKKKKKKKKAWEREREKKNKK